MFKTKIKNNLIILLLEKEDEYSSNMYELLKRAIEQKKKICYVMLKDTYENVREQFRKKRLPLSYFFFIDVLSSHYTKQKSLKNCKFLSSMDIKEIITAISEAINKHNCSVLMIDNIVNLLYHYENFEIQKLTNNLKRENIYKDVGKVYLMPKKHQLLKKESKNLLSDLTLFADEIIEL